MILVGQHELNIATEKLGRSVASSPGRYMVGTTRHNVGVIGNLGQVNTFATQLHFPLCQQVFPSKIKKITLQASWYTGVIHRPKQ